MLHKREGSVLCSEKGRNYFVMGYVGGGKRENGSFRDELPSILLSSFRRVGGRGDSKFASRILIVFILKIKYTYGHAIPISCLCT